MAKVTIILDKHNMDSIQSIKDQVYEDWELLIVDEIGSKRSMTPGIKYVRNVSNIVSEFVVFLCSGDILLPSHLYSLVEQFDEDTDVTYGQVKEFKYKNPERFSVYKKLHTRYSSNAMVRVKAISVFARKDLDFSGLKAKAIKIPVSERFYPQEMIDKWEKQRTSRYRRQMKISVIFGVRNRSRYAKRVIRSLLVQDLHRDMYDIVIVDFDSSDDLGNYVSLLKAKNITYINIPEVTVFDRAKAFNIGLKQSSGEIALFVEADLLFPKYSLRTLKDHFIDNEKQALLIKQKDLEKLETAVVIGKTYSDYAEMLKTIKAKEATRLGCIAVEREHVEAIGGFDEVFTGESYEVEDFLTRIEKHGIEKVDFSSVEVLHMWHNEPVEEKDKGYLWELAQRNKTAESAVRNIDREWGILVKKRPSVMFMLSPHVWESGTIFKYVSRFLEPHYNVTMCGLRSDIRGKTAKSHDIIYSVDWRYPTKFRANSCRFVVGVHDFHSWNEGAEHDIPRDDILNRLKLFEAVSVPCKKLGEIFVQYHPNTFYTPSAVDTEFFKPLKEKRRVSKKFTIGWVGRPEKKHTIEGFQEHIKPVCNQMSGVELFSAPGGEDINGPLQMLGFYNAIDALVLFPENSGDNKTMLEAMACGIPVITTRVADTDSIIENGTNGLIVPRNEQDLEDAIKMMRDKDSMRLNMGRAARECVIKNWDWRDISYYWKKLFDFVMETE